jgi:hypothetical protein
VPLADVHFTLKAAQLRLQTVNKHCQLTLQENEEAEAPPSPDEKSFVDDDGTAYEWDPATRRFAEVGAGGGTAAAPGVQYDEADMTFAGEDEAIPDIPEEMKVSTRCCAVTPKGHMRVFVMQIAK